MERVIKVEIRNWLLTCFIFMALHMGINSIPEWLFVITALVTIWLTGNKLVTFSATFVLKKATSMQSKYLYIKRQVEYLHKLKTDAGVKDRDKKIKMLYARITKAGWRIKHFNNLYKHLYEQKPMEE